MAAAKGTTLSQLALAWLLGRGEHVVPIPGTRNPSRVDENVAAAQLRLDAADLAVIDVAIGEGPFGSRNTQNLVWD